MGKLIVPFKMELKKKNQVISIESVCNKDKKPEDKVINANSILMIMGLLNLIIKSANTISEKTKIEKYNLETNSINNWGDGFIANLLF
jgi:hypothetical protein